MSSIYGFWSQNCAISDETLELLFEGHAGRGGSDSNSYKQPDLSIGARGNKEIVQRAIVYGEECVLAIEGEIYNGNEIGGLIGQSCTDKNIDAFQILPHLYRKYGSMFAKYLNGIFTIALYDKHLHTLYLVRDHLGSRSIFYTINSNGILFASSTWAFIKAGVIIPELAADGICNYFSATAISAPRTAMKGVFCVRPGHVLEYRGGQNAKESRYWEIARVTEDRRPGLQEYSEEVGACIDNAINIRARYGGKYGSLLSGGVDTSVIISALVRQRKDKYKMPVFSIAFNEQEYSDENLQQVMLEKYDLEPYQVKLGAEEYWKILEKAVEQLDSPVNDVAMVGMYKAFEMGKNAGCEAVFDGEAADEIFFTGHAHVEREFQKYLHIPFGIRRLMLGKTIRYIRVGGSLKSRAMRLLFRLGLSDNERMSMALPSFYKHRTSILTLNTDNKEGNPLDVWQAYLAETRLKDPLNIYYYGLLKTFLPDDLLYKNERMASANGIVNRTPFIDYRLIELGYRIPEKMKIRPRTETDDGTKIVYKMAVEGLIPDAILKRKKKRGFSQPSAIWYRNVLRERVESLLFDSDSACGSYLNRTYARRIFDEHVSGEANNDYLLNSIIIFEMWLRKHIRS
jgi:asparagine synthase (glutamine-hydrolysing)